MSFERLADCVAIFFLGALPEDVADELIAAQTTMNRMNPPTKPQLPMMLRMRSAARWPIVRWAVWSACQSRGACVLVMR